MRHCSFGLPLDWPTGSCQYKNLPPDGVSPLGRARAPGFLPAALGPSRGRTQPLPDGTAARSRAPPQEHAGATARAPERHRKSTRAPPQEHRSATARARKLRRAGTRLSFRDHGIRTGKRQPQAADRGDSGGRHDGTALGAALGRDDSRYCFVRLDRPSFPGLWLAEDRRTICRPK